MPRSAADENLLQAFFMRVEQFDVLSDGERDTLEQLLTSYERIPARTDLIHEGERPDRSTLLLDGLAFRYRLLDNGSRQIVGLHVAGDFVDLHSFPLKTMDHGIGTLSACVITRAPHQGLLKITETMPHLTRVLWLLTLVDGAIMREWIVGLGRRTATERMAHLFCEIHLRLRAVGRNGGDEFQLPITQLDFGDILGLSAVHTNRVLQQLRAMNLVSWEGARVRLLDQQALADLGGFDPQYLHQRRERR